MRLTVMSFRGQMRRWLRMMRQPKYLVGFLIGAGYLLFVFSSATIGDEGSHMFRGYQEQLIGDFASIIQFGSALIIALIVSVTWLLPWGKLGLRLKEAELHLLLPAPLTRREIIQYAVFKGQRGILIGTIIVSLFAGTGRPLDQLLMIVNLWLLFTLWDLNNKIRSMFLIRQRELPVATARLRWMVVIALIIPFWIVMGFVLVPLWEPMASRLADGEAIVLPEFIETAKATADSLAGRMLLPIRLVLAPPFAPGLGAYFLALIAPAVLLVVLLEVLLRSKARFEEEAMQHARHEARRRTRSFRREKLSSSSRRRVPFRLAPTGGPVAAVLWKNLLQGSRIPVRWYAFAGLVILLVFVFVPLVLSTAMLSGLGLLFGFIFAIAFPLLSVLSIRNDMRTELGHIDLVRTWPVKGTRFVLAQVLSPTVYGAAGGIFGLFVMLAALIGARLRTAVRGYEEQAPLLPGEGAEVFGVPWLVALVFFLLGAAPLVAAVSFLASSLMNQFALLFPAWIRLGADASRGIEAFGQRVIFSSVAFIALLISLAPGAILVTVLALIQWNLRLAWGVWNLPLWGLIGAAPVFGAGLLVVRMAATQWDTLDPGQEILEASR